MKYTLYIFIVSLTLLTINGMGQPKLEIDIEVDFVEIDNIGNIYVVNEVDLIKYSPNGVLLYRFSNQINGKITSIDVTNPLRILLFCRESNIIIFLNQQLSPISESIDIYENLNIEATNTGASTAGGFWIYSPDIQSVVLYDALLNKIQESQNLNSWINGDSINSIKELKQKLYIIINDRVIVLDLFGSYLTTIHINNARCIKLESEKLSYVKNGELYSYDMELKTENKVQLPITNMPDCIFRYKHNTYSTTKNKVLIY